MLNVTTFEAAIRWWPFLNDSGETILAFAALKVTWDADEAQWTAEKPDSDSMRVAAINGGSPVADGDYGDLSFANDGWLWAAFDGTAALDAGTRVGTVSGSWLLAEDQSGFVAVGGSGAIDDTDSNYRILVYREICW